MQRGQTMTDAQETPYQLTWTTEQYRDLGPAIGFAFEENDFHRAFTNELQLGTKRYLPSPSAEIELPFPPGVLVNCRLEPIEPVVKYFTPGAHSHAQLRNAAAAANSRQLEESAAEALLPA